MIKTWEQRCEDEFDDDAVITSRDIMDKMQDEIDELRAALSQAEQNHLRSEALSSKTVRWESPPDWSAS